MKRAFTLIELLVILAIIAVMISVGVVSITAGKGAARVKGATRDVFAAIRCARSTALVTMKPVIITYSTVESGGEVMAKIEITSAKIMDTTTDRSQVQTLTGEPLQSDGYELVHIEKADESKGSAKAGSKVGSKADSKVGASKATSKPADGEPAAASESEGESVEEILFAPVNEDIVKGMRVKVVLGDEALAAETAARPSKISVFSNVDYLIGRFKDAKAAAKKKEDEASGKTDDKSAAPKDELQEPVSVVWETNGRVDPHQVWVYADGQKPEDGLLIKVDRFGAAKVLPGDGREEK